MKKIIGLALGAVAMVALSGCNTTGTGNGPINGSNGQRAYIYTTDLETNGYKISGWDTRSNESVDLCFDGYENYVYGRGNTYYEGTYSIKDDSDIVFRDTTDGGSYRLYTNGEITEGYTYDFGNTLPQHDVRVDSIAATSNINLCKSSGKRLRVFSTIKKSI